MNAMTGPRKGKREFERVRKLCLSLPDTEERLSHGEPTFFVKKRVFVMFATNHHGDGRYALWCNAAEGAQEILTKSDPENFFIPPYVGKAGWVGVRLDRTLDWGHVASVVNEAYRVTRGKRRLKGG
jgi:hypothetical protein